MSIGLMTAVFKTEFRDLSYTKDGEERKAKASTCKLLLLAIADNANDEGQAYPGYSKLEIKTALSRQGIADTLEALRQNGIIQISESPSRLGTNDYYIQKSAFPSLSNEIIDESSHLTTTSQATLLEVVKPLDYNHHLTINQPSHGGFSKPKDLVDGYLELSQAPGIKREARLNDILSYLGVTFRRNTSTKEWLTFAKYIDSEFQTKGWDVKQFVAWLFGQKDYNPNYWPVKKMMEFYPSAFEQDEQIEYTRLL